MRRIYVCKHWLADEQRQKLANNRGEKKNINEKINNISSIRLIFI